MGKRDKKQKHHDGHSRRRDFKFNSEGDVAEDGDLHSYPVEEEEVEEEVVEVEEDAEEEEQETSNEGSSVDIPSKFQLYQQSVQVWAFFLYC